MRSLLGLSVIASLTLFGCADGGGDPDGSTSDPDGGASTQRDGGRRDSGSGACPSGQHRCGGGCIDDLANEPANGCRYGCGEACPTPPDGDAACDEAGLCTFACPPPFHREGTECVCTARTCEELGFMCGAPDDGCGTPLDCGSCAGDGVCIEGTCACTPDAEEPNDSILGVATIGGTLTDSPESNATFDAFNLDAPDDEDWFRIAVSDELDCCSSTNPDITVTLSGIPTGSDYELSAWYICTTGTDDSACTVGRPCTGSASGTTQEEISFTTECGGTSDEHGALWIRVTSSAWGGACAPYHLQVHVN